MRFQRIYTGPIKTADYIHIIDYAKPPNYEGKNCLSAFTLNESLRVGWAQGKKDAPECVYCDLTQEDFRVIAGLLKYGGNTAVKEWIKELILWWILK